ncbi:MAG: ISL3 family transposase, partial [Nanoarchaeota archaeon]
MSKSITSLLGIQGWFKVEDIKEKERSIHLFLKPLRKTAVCPRCGKRTKIGYDIQPLRSILHTNIGEKLLYLHICPRRFVCPCNPSKPFRERFQGIKERRSTTEKFDQELLKHLSGQSFKTVERKYTLSYPAARVRLLEAVNPMDIRWDLVSNLDSIHLGLDGHHLVNKKFVETIAEVKQRIPLGILPNDKKLTLKQALLTCPQSLKARVKSATVDMSDKTINAVKEALPNAIIVIDHYHVIQDANQRLNKARLIEQEVINQERAKRGLGRIEIEGRLLRRNKENLSEKRKEKEYLELFLNLYSRLKIWYVCKERLRDVYKAETRDEAKQLLESLIITMRTSDDIELYLWGKTLIHYKEEILNYFVYRTTNAYTEGLHVKCKLVQRISCGFRNAEVYIRKALLVLLPLSVAITN